MLDLKNIVIRILTTAAVILISLSFSSCTLADEPETGGNMVSSESNTDIYLFDYREIEIDTTSSIGVRVKNCNIYVDEYDDLIILGELENSSSGIKTDLEITIDLMGTGTDPVYTAIVPVKTDYLRSGARYPFDYYFTERQKYIEISSVKIGVNYRDYNDDFKGNPIAEIEDYSYQGDFLVIRGRAINIGEEKIKNLKLLCTFYDNRDRVVFIKECHLSRERMMPGEVQDFTLKLYMDSYLEDFTDFHFEIFFEDEIRVNM